MPKKATNKRPARQRNHAITWRCGNCPKSVKSFHTGSKSRHHLRTHQDSHLPEFWTRVSISYLNCQKYTNGSRLLMITINDPSQLELQ